MGRRPFSLSAYLALTRARERPTLAATSWPERPQGALLWLHADTLERTRILLSLSDRLTAQRDATNIVVTCDALRGDTDKLEGREVFAPPQETLSEIQRFLRHWSPDVALWAGNGLRPALIHQAHRDGCRLFLADARDAVWRQPGKRWLPDASTAALGLFETIYCTDEEAARRLRRMGVPDRRIETTGALQRENLPLPCPDALHEEIAGILAGRPVWLCAHVQRCEADAVLRAHRRASRLAHRLLLVVVPDHPEEEAEISEMAQDIGLRVARWENGEMPDENTQVLLTRDDAELGLWYRLAPLCFLGGSLFGNSGGHDPMMAAALGAAVLYGPQVGNHLSVYSQLVEAGAARIVKDMDSLSTAVTHLIAPDRAAAMAHAGWEVISAGAETNDRILARIGECLDSAEASS